MEMGVSKSVVEYAGPLDSAEAEYWFHFAGCDTVKSGRKRERRITIVDPCDKVLDRFRLLFPAAERGARRFDDYLDRCAAAGALV